MCTVSWRFRPSGYELWFNRDESRKRSRALPPAIHHPAGGTPYLSPTDPDGGGTWLASDHHGTTTAILNYYDAEPPIPHPAPQSRGKLVTALASGHLTPAQIDPTTYRPFHLLQITAAQHTTLLTWSGTHLQERKLPPLLSTSSYKTQEVLAFRETAFTNFPDPQKFHTFHDPAHPAHSPLMSRADSRTVSLLKVSAGPESISQHYTEAIESPSGSPSPAPSSTTASLPYTCPAPPK